MKKSRTKSIVGCMFLFFLFNMVTYYGLFATDPFVLALHLPQLYSYNESTTRATSKPETCEVQAVNEYAYASGIPKRAKTGWRNSHYKYDQIPNGTLTYWNSHFEGKKRVKDKAYFADKYLVKQYIQNYTKIENGRFSYVDYAHVLIHKIDYANAPPTFDQFVSLKATYGAFLVKPNHFCGSQIIIGKDDVFTRKTYRKILQFAKDLSNRVYDMASKSKWNFGPHLEDQYFYIKPRIFVEQHLNAEQSGTENDYLNNNTLDDMVEYKIIVVHYRAVVVYVTKKPFKNLYTVDNFTLLNVRWGMQNGLHVKIRAPFGDNLQKMVAFSEHFARREHFPFVRVDLYEIEKKIYFSEFTFTTGFTTSIIEPVAFDYLLHDILCDPSQKNIDKIYKFAADQLQ
eukprot:105233_1